MSKYISKRPQCHREPPIHSNRHDLFNTMEVAVQGKRSHVLSSKSLQSTLGDENILVTMNNTEDAVLLSGKLSGISSSATATGWSFHISDFLYCLTGSEDKHQALLFRVHPVPSTQ